MYEAGIYMLINSCYVGILSYTEDTESASRARWLRVDLTLYHGLTHVVCHMPDHVCDVQLHPAPPHFARKAGFFVCTIDLLGRFLKLSGKKWRRRDRRHTLFHYWSRFCLFPRKGKEWSYPVSVCVCSYVCVCVCARACVRMYCTYSNTNVSESIVMKHFIQAAVHHTFTH